MAVDETINEIYKHRSNAFERQIRLVENRLQFVNWLFGVSSASLFGALTIINTIEISSLCIWLRADIAALFGGIFAFSGIVFTYLAKKEGYRSIQAVIEQLTYLDVQATTLLDENLPEEPQYDRVVRFADDDYLEPKTKIRMKELDKLPERKTNELYWQEWILKSVFGSLFFLLISMAQIVLVG